METAPHPLDNPIWHALSGLQTQLGTVGTLAGYFDPSVAPFAALAERAPAGFAQLAAMAGPDRSLAFFTNGPLGAPESWEMLRTETLEQFVCDAAKAPRTAGTLVPIELQPADVPEMLALTAATEPGPFGPGTIRCGRYLGMRAPETGALVAMTGERLRLPSAIEISAVCTAPSHRGQGLAAMLVHLFASAMLARGQTPFLHARPANTSAIALYEALGFRHRRSMTLSVMRSPHA